MTDPCLSGNTLDLDAIEARTNKATPGPWGIGNGTTIGLGIENMGGGAYSYDVELAEICPDFDRAFDLRGRDEEIKVASAEDDAEFIAHARTDVVRLLAEARKVAEFRKLAAELRAKAAPVLERDPVENGISAGEVFEAEWMDHLASLIEGVLDGNAPATADAGGDPA
jgi:histidyl-tRNA synthetase